MVFKLDQFQNEMCKKKVSGKHHCINKLLIAMGYTLKPTASNILPVANSPPPDPHGHPSLRATALIKVANLADNSHNKHH
jgi:hypothetical protein